MVSAAGILGGLFFAVSVQNVSASSFFASFNELSQPWDLWMALIKAACFGFLAGMVACYKGYYAKGGPKGVGDAVNQAARLQVKTRDLGRPILITDSTRRMLSPARRVPVVPCGPVPLRGFTAPIEVFAVDC